MVTVKRQRRNTNIEQPILLSRRDDPNCLAPKDQKLAWNAVKFPLHGTEAPHSLTSGLPLLELKPLVPLMGKRLLIRMLSQS